MSAYSDAAAQFYRTVESWSAYNSWMVCDKTILGPETRVFG
ncbi:MAG: hypothetical protein ACYTFA_09220 [Planctomycetota bacterium]